MEHGDQIPSSVKPTDVEQVGPERIRQAKLAGAQARLDFALQELRLAQAAVARLRAECGESRVLSFA